MTAHLTTSNTTTQLVSVVNNLIDTTDTHTSNISTANANISSLTSTVNDLVADQSNLDALFDSKMDKAGGTFTGQVKGTTFRATKGSPNASNSSTRGFAFGTDGDTGFFAIDGTGDNDTTKLGFYIQNSLKSYVDADGNLTITGTPNQSYHVVNKEYTDAGDLAVRQYVDNSKNNMLLTGYTNTDVLGIGVPNHLPQNLLDIYAALNGGITLRSPNNVQLQINLEKIDGEAFSLGYYIPDGTFKMSTDKTNLNNNTIWSVDTNGNGTWFGTWAVSAPNNSMGLAINVPGSSNQSGIGFDSNSNSIIQLRDSTGTIRQSMTASNGLYSGEKLYLSGRSGVTGSILIKSPSSKASVIDMISNGRGVTYDWRIQNTTDNLNLEILYGGSLGTGYGKKFAITASGAIYTSNLWSTGPAAYINELSPRSFVNFTVVGTEVSILSSFNIISVVRNGTGDFTLTFNTDLPSTNYAVISNASSSTGTVLSSGENMSNILKSTNQLRIKVATPSNNAVTDPKVCSVMIFGG